MFEFYKGVYTFIILGYGVYATRDFKKSSLLLEYKGEIISSDEADKRQKKYEKKKMGCFLYYFKEGKDCLWYELFCSFKVKFDYNDLLNNSYFLNICVYCFL